MFWKGISKLIIDLSKQEFMNQVPEWLIDMYTQGPRVWVYISGKARDRTDMCYAR